jgi:hypothetical protein
MKIYNPASLPRMVTKGAEKLVAFVIGDGRGEKGRAGEGWGGYGRAWEGRAG